MDFSDLIKYFKDQKKEEQTISPEEARKREFLSYRKDIESLGQPDRVNAEHKTMKSGIHSGSGAFGAYGLMPNTVRNVVSTEYNPKKEIGPSLHWLKNASNDEIKAILKDNEPLQEELAGKYYDKSLRIHPNATDEQLHYLYNMGFNTEDSKMTPENVLKNSSVQRYLKLKEQLLSEINPKNKIP